MTFIRIIGSADLVVAVAFTALISSAQTASAATYGVQPCDPLAVSVVGKQLVRSGSIISCSAEKWPGLKPNEYYLTFELRHENVNDLFSREILTVIFNKVSGETMPAPRRPGLTFVNSPAALAQQLVTAYLNQADTVAAAGPAMTSNNVNEGISPTTLPTAAAPQSRRLMCSEVTTEHFVTSLSNRNGSRTWEVHITKPFACTANTMREVPQYTAQEITVLPGVVSFKISASIGSTAVEPDFSQSPFRIKTRQKFFSTLNREEKLAVLLKRSESFCPEIKSATPQIAETPIFNQNATGEVIHRTAGLTAAANSNTSELRARSANETRTSLANEPRAGSANEALASSANEARSSSANEARALIIKNLEGQAITNTDAETASLLLEEADESGFRPHIMGAWQISAHSELSNLVYFPKRFKKYRVRYRDPVCGP